MGHLHTNLGEHDLTASAFVVRDDFPEPRLLLHMHKKLGVLLQPGGHVELNENPWQAIEHELREESGYTFDQLEVLQPAGSLQSITNAELHPMPVVVNTHDFDSEGTHKHTDISFAFVAHGEPLFAPADGESRDLRWLSVEQLNALDSTEIFENVREIGRYVLDRVYSDWERVTPVASSSTN
jgi:8-oxo-dGTP pyrophosphatase MutT (NUDIX family)